MNKAKILIVSAMIGGAALAFASMAGAQVVQLGATCTGTVGTGTSTNVVTWSSTPSGGVAPYSFAWTGTNLNATSTGTSSVVTATYTATSTAQTVTANLQVTDATSTVATTTCSATIAALPPVTPTSTPTSTVTSTPNPTSTIPLPPRMNQPQLQIVGNGRFLARGMTVTAVASGSIQAQVWGITYTINLRSTGMEFLRRDGNNITLVPSQQILVGDEVSASGFIDPSAPLVVNAGVVRDFSIIQVRANRGDDNESEGEHGDRSNGGFFGGLPGTTTTPSGTTPSTPSQSTIDAQNRLNELLKQLQGLQNLFNSRRGGNGGGEGHGGRD